MLALINGLSGAPIMFSNSYDQARACFLQAAKAVGAQLQTESVVTDDDLTVDVALLGDRDSKRAIVLTSGLHGVEGFFGSAVQIALLERYKRVGLDQSIKFVLVHALNPYGFKYLRRFDQNNIDLNRNFLAQVGEYSGAPAGYSKLNPFLNPDSPPSKREPYFLKALLNIGRYGIPSLKASIVGGQYEYPKGLFFGGAGSSETANIVRQNCDQWIGDAEAVVHVDLHSGLGSFGDCKLLLNESGESEQYKWYSDVFGDQHIEPLTAPEGTAYQVKGSMGDWLQKHFADRKYYFVGAEFGTYSAIRVLGAIRAENRLQHYGDSSHPIYNATKAELLECFCPQSKQWRNKVVDSSLDIVTAAAVGVKNC